MKRISRPCALAMAFILTVTLGAIPVLADEDTPEDAWKVEIVSPKEGFQYPTPSFTNGLHFYAKSKELFYFPDYIVVRWGRPTSQSFYGATKILTDSGYFEAYLGIYEAGPWKIWADSYNSIHKKLAETEKVLVHFVDPLNAPDLVVSTFEVVTLMPGEKALNGTVSDNKRYYFVWTVKNVGDRIALPSKLKIECQAVAGEDCPSSLKKSYDIKQLWPKPDNISGAMKVWNEDPFDPVSRAKFRFRATIDPDNKFVEQKETNNTLMTEFDSGAPIAQLKISNIMHIAAVSPTVSPSAQVVYGSTGGTAIYTITGGVAPYNVMTNDSNFPPSPAAVTDSGGTFIVTVPGNSTAKTVTYTVKDSANKTAAAQLVIALAQEGGSKKIKASSKIRLRPLPFPKYKAFLIGANVPLRFETLQKTEKLKYEFMRYDGNKLSPKETPRFISSKTSKGAGKFTITQYVKFSEPGKYRYRCSPDGGKSWSGWKEIMVKEPGIKAKGKLKMKGASTAGKKVAKKTESTRKMPKLGAPSILNLKTGKVFTAPTDITLKAKHHSAYNVTYELQKKNSKGRYVPFKTAPDGKFSNLKAGEYRVCIAYDLKGALPGKGIEFIVEEKKLKVKKTPSVKQKKMPSVEQKKMPSIKQKVLKQ